MLYLVYLYTKREINENWQNHMIPSVVWMIARTGPATKKTDRSWGSLFREPQYKKLSLESNSVWRERERERDPTSAGSYPNNDRGTNLPRTL